MKHSILLCKVSVESGKIDPLVKDQIKSKIKSGYCTGIQYLDFAQMIFLSLYSATGRTTEDGLWYGRLITADATTGYMYGVDGLQHLRTRLSAHEFRHCSRDYITTDIAALRSTLKANAHLDLLTMTTADGLIHLSMGGFLGLVCFAGRMSLLQMCISWIPTPFTASCRGLLEEFPTAGLYLNQF